LSSGQRPKHTAYASQCMFSRLERDVEVEKFCVCLRRFGMVSPERSVSAIYRSCESLDRDNMRERDELVVFVL
jgi:hypothetical protein